MPPPFGSYDPDRFIWIEGPTMILTDIAAVDTINVGDAIVELTPMLTEEKRAALQAEAAELTRLYPPGTAAWFFPSADGLARRTRVTAEYGVAESGTLVGWVEGEAGYVAADHVHAVEPGRARPWIRAGACVCLLDRVGRRVLLGRRSDDAPTGAGQWAFPGGHVEYGESPAEAASRELLEETGLVASPGALRLWTLTHTRCPENGFYHVTAVYRDELLGRMAPPAVPGETEVEWRWFDWLHLPEPLFPPVAALKAAGDDPFREDGR